MSDISKFRAAYASGLFIPDSATVSALSLIFEKIYLPNGIEFVTVFSRKFRFTESALAEAARQEIEITQVAPEGEKDDPFSGLTSKQRETAIHYLKVGLRFCVAYSPLFSEVIETDMFQEGQPLDVELVRQGHPGKVNTYRVKYNDMILKSEDEETLPKLLSQGYIPVVGKFHPDREIPKKLDPLSAKQLAALLAMESVKIVFPQTKQATPDIILEARHRLRNELPPFWSAMLKLSLDLKSRVRGCDSAQEVFRETQDLVDVVVRPALIDLQTKLEKERKDWFYKILGPIEKGLRILIGNPPITQQQLMTNALMLGADVVMDAVENMRRVEALKQEAGITFLLEAADIFDGAKNS